MDTHGIDQMTAMERKALRPKLAGRRLSADVAIRRRAADHGAATRPLKLLGAIVQIQEAAHR